MNEPQHARTGDEPRTDASDPDAGVAVPIVGVGDASDGGFRSSSSEGLSGPETSAAGPPADPGNGADPVIDSPAVAGRASAASAEPDNDDHGAAVQKWRERTAKRRKQGRKRPWWVEVPILLVTAFVLTFLIQTFLFKVYYVPSGSMEKTLHGVESGGDRILVNKIIYDFSDPDPGDVVVFKGPPSWAPEANIPGPTSWIGKLGQAVGSVVGIAPANEKDFVKRVIATGGQTVECCDSNGNILVDGVPLDESAYIYEPIEFVPGQIDCSSNPKSQRCFGPITVPDGQLWVMGDHRSHSADSTYGCQGGRDASSCQGPIPVDDVIGKAIFIVMPVSRWDTIGDPGIDHRAGG